MYRSCSSPRPSQTRAESTSDEGTTSRRPRLPSANQDTGQGGAPSSSTANSISLRVSASVTTAMIEAIWAGGYSASFRAITAGRSSPAARRRPSTSSASSIARRSANGARASAASRSLSLRTPRTSPWGQTTGACRMSRSSISSITSAPSRSGVTVNAGKLITSVTGASTRHASRHHPIAQVMVGQDSQLAIRQTNEGSGRFCLGHSAGGLAHGVARVADDRLVVHQPSDRLLSRVEVTCRRRQIGPRASQQAARHVTHSRRPGKQRYDGVRGQPIAERVLTSPGLESRG